MDRTPTFTMQFCIVWIALVGLSAGCGGPTTAQVSGKVHFKDGSVPQAKVRVVRFEPMGQDPEQAGKVASGQIEDDGTFTLYTRKPGDGVVPGDYAVTFSVWKGPMEPESLIDEQYIQATTTPYKVTVEHDLDGLDFELEAKH